MCNMFSLICDVTNDAVVVDPSCQNNFEFNSLESHLKDKNVKHILLTHGHPDHVVGLAEAAKRWPDARIHLHPLEEENYNVAQEMGQHFGLQVPTLPTPTDELADGKIFKVGEHIELRCVHTPGHAPGHIAFVDERTSTESNGAVILGGDLLFRGSVGRTDLFNSSMDDLNVSLRRLYEEFDDDSMVLSGHTTPTYLRDERASNPFVGLALRLPEDWYQEAKKRHGWI